MSTELEFDLIHDGSAKPERWMYLLHGIYGAGRNWNAVARRLVTERPDWGVVSIDLRGHGGSPAGTPPHTVEACADDLAALSAAADPAPPASAVMGHSFGGKVATVFAAREDSVRALFVVDSTPSARPPSGSAWKMLEALERNPGPFPDRNSGIAAVESEGYPRAVAQWMGTNLTETAPGRWEWRLALDQMTSLLNSFFELDAWPSLRQAAESGVHVDLLRATESSIMDEADRTRLAEMSDSGLAVRLTPVRGGHWLNADNPDRVVELLKERLPRA